MEEVGPSSATAATTTKCDKVCSKCSPVLSCYKNTFEGLPVSVARPEIYTPNFFVLLFENHKMLLHMHITDSEMLTTVEYGVFRKCSKLVGKIALIIVSKKTVLYKILYKFMENSPQLLI